MVKITKLNKYFNKKKSNEIHVINDATLEFPQTGLISIVGESGSGKTTLMNVLGGLDDFESGMIEIDNTKITNSDKTMTGELVIPEGITSIGNSAFSLSGVTSVYIPKYHHHIILELTLVHYLHLLLY